MSNYFWTVDGRYLKRNVIEYMTNSNLNINNNSLCLDDVCITKNEISEIKRLLPGYNILERSKSFDGLTISEIKLYLKKVFEKILKSTNDVEKRNLFIKYFIYGLYDPKSADLLPFSDFYLNSDSKFIDFQDLYLAVDSFNINRIELPEDIIKYVMETKNTKIDDRLHLNISTNDIKNLGINAYMINYKNYTIQLIKVNATGENIWKMVLITSNLLNSMFIKQDEIFNDKFKKELEILNVYNLRNELSLTEFRDYIYNLRGVSLLDGKFNIDVFKNNIFVNYYKLTLDISKLTDDEIMSKIDNPDKFNKIEFKNLQDEKIYLGYYQLHTHYISLEDNEDYDIKLIYGQKNTTDIFKWMIIFIKK